MKNIASGLTQILIQNAPKICIYLGLGGLIKATVDSGIKASQVKEKIEKYKKENNIEIISPADYIKLTWKDYAPIALEAAMSACLIVAGDTAHTHRTAALATAYSISSTSLEQYKQKVQETLTEDKFKEIEQKIAQEKVNQNPAGNNTVVVTGKGDYLCYEPISGQYFRSTWDSIHQTYLNLMDTAMQGSGVITLADWLYALGLNVSKYDNNPRWDLSNGKANWPNIYASSVIADNDEPAISIGYMSEPREY